MLQDELRPSAYDPLTLSGDNFARTTSRQIELAANHLRSGQIVAFPTETVYGLGADITQPQAIEKIFKIKGRPSNHPLIAHFADMTDLEYWASEIPTAAWLLAEQFWPGPLTLILPKSNRIPASITGGQDTVGLRIPRHPIAQALLRALGTRKAIAAPSANRFGHLSPTAAMHVREEFKNEIGVILDGGSCEVGLESTIVSCIGKTVTLLRPGGISVDAIENVLTQKILGNPVSHSVRASGSLPAHYAPDTPLEICSTGSDLWIRARWFQQQGKRTAILTHTPLPDAHKKQLDFILMPDNPVTYGKILYATLRRLDQLGYDQLLIEAPPSRLDWLAVTDRLQRASYHYLKQS
ncbi:L-threonylcarbamoyladenylate synthase [Nitrosomonas halophila]|uniref:Threonylcarbamoyl-AMP synthase n=1 Tax=Nitrosomonas halophila TaxID=44576 RepID=A0A1H3NBR9_9PROT|nr:L-threonylcarbamoyladenylate synthase [Nitrosomonas halophila]SDY86183.1 L-threonylcarbamoyladenylate synthase [Nitrosomonas halophila]